jgi:hypothetical protein
MGSPNNWAKTHFFANNETQINSQTVNCTPRNHGLVTGAHGPGNLSGSPSGRPPAPLGRNSASLEGDSAVPPKLRLARGLDSPSGETPPRSRAMRPLGQDSASLEGWTPPRAKLRLARGLCAPSGRTPPRSRAMRPLGQDSASLETLAGPPLPHPLPRPER